MATCGWVQDWYGKYTAEPVTDPQGPLRRGSDRVIRGGGWGHDAGNRSADRSRGAPERGDHLGFRLLRTAP